MKSLHRYSLYNISCLFLYLLILSININGTDLYMTKEIFFFLFIMTSFNYGNYKKLFFFILLFSIFIFSATLNLIIPGSNLTYEAVIANSLGLIYLVLLIYNKEVYKKTIISAYFISAIVVACITIILWFICNSSKEMQTAVIAYFAQFKSVKDTTIVIINYKKILHWWFLGVFFNTAPCMIPVLGYCFLYALKNGKNKYFLHEIILTIGLIMSGTRANMMSALLLCAFYFGFLLLKNKHYYIAFFSIFIAMIVGIIFAYLFLTTTEASLTVKNLHKLAYYREFNKDMLRTIFFGWGAGSSFYTEGFKDYATITELSHLETIRRYGLINTFLIFFVIWLRPLFYIFFKEREAIKYFYGLVIVAYVCVACTNPFLIGGIGFCALLFMSEFFEFGFLNDTHKSPSLFIRNLLKPAF